MSYSCCYRTSQSKILNWYDFVMKHVIITFRQVHVLFSDSSTSGLKSALIIRSWLPAFVAILMLFLKFLMRKVFNSALIVLKVPWYRFRKNENVKLLRCYFFALLPQKFILTGFVKRFSEKVWIKSSLFCDFSNWKHVRTIATCKKKTFSSRKFRKIMFCYFCKIRSRSNNFYHPFHTFPLK